MTWELYQKQKQLLEKSDMIGLKNVFHNIEMPLLPILEDMQRTGVNLNQKMLNQFYDKYNSQLKLAEQKVQEEIYKHENEIQTYRIEHPDCKLEDPINIGSPTQLSILFYKILKYKTKSGKGTGVSELEEINTPLTQALLDYRKAQKLIDAFIISLPKKINKWDNKIHTSLNQYRCCNR